MRCLKTVFCGLVLPAVSMAAGCSPEMPKTCVLDLDRGYLSLMQTPRELGHDYYRMSAKITSVKGSTYTGTGGYLVPEGGGSHTNMIAGENLMINPESGYCSTTLYIGKNDIGFETRAIRANVRVIPAQGPRVKGKGRSPH